MRPERQDDQVAAFEAHRSAVVHDEERRLRRGIVSLLFIVILVGALVFAIPGLGQVADHITDARPGWIALALVLEFGSCAGYVYAFRLVFWRVPGLLATRVALSEMAFGAVLPVGGAGGIAIGAYVARAKGGSLRVFMERSAVLFLLTTGVNAATLGLAGMLVAVGVLDGPEPLALGLIPGVVGVAGVVFFWYVPELTRRLPARQSAGRVVGWLHTTGRVVDATRHEIRSPHPWLLGAVAYLWCDIAVLWVCFHAFGETMPVGALSLAFLIGYLGNVVPVPGGIGALDGGLTGALILYGAPPAAAAAAVLVYHAMVLWLPTLLGTIAFTRLRPEIHEPMELGPPRVERGRRRPPGRG
jgi:uncharacterized membrane protein YbhN (UPF0104 family)